MLRMLLPRDGLARISRPQERQAIAHFGLVANFLRGVEWGDSRHTLFTGDAFQVATRFPATGWPAMV